MYGKYHNAMEIKQLECFSCVILATSWFYGKYHNAIEIKQLECFSCVILATSWF